MSERPDHLPEMTPERLREIESLLTYESSISFQSGRAHESMWMLVAEVRRLRERHDPRCLSLTDSENNVHCDCRTLAAIDGAQAVTERAERAEAERDTARGGQPQWAESLVEQRCAAGQHVTWFVDRDAAFPCPWCQRDAARTEVMAELLDARRRAEQAERRAGDAEKHLIDSAGFDMADLMRSLDDCVDRAEQAEAEVKRLHDTNLVIAVFGVPEDAPQPFALINQDPQPKPFALGVQWPGGTVTVKSTPPERLGNTTSQSLEDFFTQYGQSAVVWLSEDLGSLADMEERAELAEAALARVRKLALMGGQDPADIHRQIIRALDSDGDVT